MLKKTYHEKRAGGVVQGVDLNSNPSTSNTKKKFFFIFLKLTYTLDNYVQNSCVANVDKLAQLKQLLKSKISTFSH
jgi:hypothetical protein